MRDREPMIEALGSGHLRRRPIKRSFRRNDLWGGGKPEDRCPRTQNWCFQKKGVVKSVKHFRENKQVFWDMFM